LTLIPAIAADGTLYPIEKLEAHLRGVQHLAVSVFVFSGDELLIQRRAAGKYHCGGLWANTCCTHPHWGETVEACAARRLREELGIDVPVTAGATVEYAADVGGGMTENERVRVFRGAADRHDLRIVPNPEEVSETRWASPRALCDEARRRPGIFTPWFRIYLERWGELAV